MADPNWVLKLSEWSAPMRTQLKGAIETFIGAQSRFDDLTIADIQVAGSRYYGGFKNGNRLREKVSDLDVQVYCDQSAVNWGTGFQYHTIDVRINIKTKPLGGVKFVTYAMGHRTRAAGYNLPVRSLTDDIAYGDLAHADIELWNNRNN